MMAEGTILEKRLDNLQQEAERAWRIWQDMKMVAKMVEGMAGARVAKNKLSLLR